MPEIDLFAFYRRLLLIVVGTYGVIRLILFIWRWRASSLTAARPEALLRRWVELSALRLRVRRFTLDTLQILLLMAILGYVLWLQLGPPMPRATVS